MAQPRLPLKRIVAEFFAIAAGVALGLFADDFRQSRIDLQTEEEYLQLLLRDLASDTAAVGVARRGIAEQAESAELILRSASDPVTEDELDSALGSLFFTWTYEQPQPTYVSLLATGDFGLIRDAGLRSRIPEYYEVTQARLQAYVQDYRIAVLRLRSLLGGRVRLYPPESVDTLWPLPDGVPPVEYSGSVSSLREDQDLWNEIMEVGARCFELLEYIDAYLATNETLRSEILAYIG